MEREYIERTRYEQRGEMGEAEENNKYEPLREGMHILEGRYRIIQMLYQRPRLNLYLGRRVTSLSSQLQVDKKKVLLESLVAIRELDLTHLDPLLRTRIEAAAFEEFTSPIVSGSPRLPTMGDRMFIDGERCYLIMQLQTTKSVQDAIPMTLGERLYQSQWPGWLRQDVALSWITHLGRMVARLHRLGVILGDLSPATILIDTAGMASWAPILLVSWPPAPQFWPICDTEVSPDEQYFDAFPIAESSAFNVFVAPEVLAGVYDERSDVYSLGGLLYLLLTHHAPAAAAHRLCAAGLDSALVGEEGRLFDTCDGLALIPPRFFCHGIAPTLEQMMLRALELHPDRRYSSVFEFVEDLEALELNEISVPALDEA